MKLDDIITKFASQFDLSDFHVRSNQPLSLRENGTIITDPSNVISREQLETFWKDHLNKSQLQEVASKKDLDFAVVVNGQRYRANGYYTTHGPCMVLRKIGTDLQFLLNFTHQLYKILVGKRLTRSTYVRVCMKKNDEIYLSPWVTISTFFS